MIFQDGQHIHFVGIGGFGLSAIARILLERGYRVSGSDRAPNALTAALVRDGATFYTGHAAAHIVGADMLIVSSAVPPENPEVAAALAAGIPVHKRQSILAHLMGERRVVGVAGTHGKTTTTAMVVHLLRESGQDPSYIVGGVMANTGTNAGNGAGESFVIEADEYDNAFLGLYPELAIVTSVEFDHPDFFKTPESLTDAFRQYIARLHREHGVLIACADDAGARALAAEQRQKNLRVFTYGLSADANLRAVNLEVQADGSTAFDVLQGEIYHGRARLMLPGRHNVQNALAALYVAGTGHDLALSDVIPHLATFKGTGRRFEVRGQAGGVIVVDDYAHHPTAIRTTIDAAKQRFPQHQVWAVWQPHTYSRTQALWDAYRDAFGAAEHVLVTDIFAAREQPLEGVTSAAFVASMAHPSAVYGGSLAACSAYLLAHVQAPAVILIMSAGDAPKIGIDYLNARELPQ